jgi:hypothetical protein
MAFLDNSGDIILDAVLTDTGRERLARGDGSFKITKFALGDDEINYELYNRLDSRGSAFYDLEILQTPVLESFTNNTSTMKSKLITITRTNVLYLPVVLYNSNKGTVLGGSSLAAGLLAITVDTDTSESGKGGLSGSDYFNAFSPKDSARPLVFDQGLNTQAISKEASIPIDLNETQYTIEMDNRLLSLTNTDGLAKTPSFIDDDSIASYSVSESPFVIDNSSDTSSDNPIRGPRGSQLTIGVQSSIDVQSSTYLFTTLGSTVGAGPVFYFIDTNIRVIGQTTGYRIDLPVRLLKFKQLTP